MSIETAAATALNKLGELYRNADGVEVWRIRNLEGVIEAEDIASDFDAACIALELFNL